MADLLGRLQGSLASSYRIEREVGAGGMAVVFLAEDLRHRRLVALKVLRPELAAEIGPGRFLREIETAARLTHPHILPIHDSGEAEGFLYYVMPYVEGESLRARLTREKQLPLDDALQIAREVADALSYAHSHGVVHRDIKPENILLQSGHAVVADFGIARAITAAAGETRTATLTAAGTALGTPAYMSPEQAAGSRDLDGRSDLYSLGCVLYEMLAGQPPFTGPSVESLLHQHLTAEAPSIAVIRPAVPGWVAAAIQRALAKTPADRFSPVALFAEALAPRESAAMAAAPQAPALSSRRRRLALLGAAALIAVAATVLVLVVLKPFGLGNRAVPGAAGSIESIAVLPLENYSGDPGQEYFVDGMTEELTTRLAQIGSLRVIARTSAMRYTGARKSISKIGRELNVDAVVEGSVLRVGDRARVTAQLIRAATEEHLWARSYDRGIADVLTLQSEVAQAIAREIQAKVTSAEWERLGRGSSVDPAAYEAYLHGRYLWNQRTRASVERSIQFFREATARDPNYALAHAGLASAYIVLPTYRPMPSRDIVPKSRDAAMKALELDPSLGEARAALAGIKSDFDWDPVAAEKEFRHALELSPNNASVHQWYGEFLTQQGRRDEAMAELEIAARLDPLSPIVSAMMIDVFYVARQYDLAIERCRRTLERFPDFKTAHRMMGDIYLAKGDYEAAISEFERAGARMDALRVAFRESGPPGYWRKLLEISLERSKNQYVPPRFFAIHHAQLGERDLALSWLEKACEERDVKLTWLLATPFMDPLRTDPRFREIARRVGVPG